MAGAGKQGGQEWRSQDQLFAVPLSRHSFEIATGDLAAASFDAAIGWLTRTQKNSHLQQLYKLHTAEPKTKPAAVNPNLRTLTGCSTDINQTKAHLE